MRPFTITLTHLLVSMFLVPGVSLHAETCTFEGWRVSKSGAVSDWAGSREKTLGKAEWSNKSGWMMAAPQDFNAENGDIFVVCDLMADSAYKQDLYTKGTAEVRVNGSSPKLLAHGIYELDLKNGRNTFELKFNQPDKKEHEAKQAKQPDVRRRKPYSPIVRFAMRPMEYDYATQPLAMRVEAARLAIEALGAQYPEYESARYLHELKKAKDDAAVEKLRYQALVLDNPEVDFDQILFRASGSNNMPSNFQGNSLYLRSSGEPRTPTFNDEIRIFNVRDRSVKTVYAPTDPREGLLDIALDYDAGKFLYSGVDTADNTFQIFEMNVDGSGKRQITENLPEIDHYNAIYLPSGKILFSSTAALNAVPCIGGRGYVGNLYAINSDGTGMRQISFDQENDFYPWVTEDGRVMFLRWEYTDNSHYFTRILVEMNPDGTNLRSIYGSNSYWPNTMFYAKTIPDKPSQFVAICSGHHGARRAGELVIFDTTKGEFEADGAIQRIPGRGKKIEPVIVDNYMDGRSPQFLHPYPLSENFFLVSGKLHGDQKWTLCLVDRFDNIIKLLESDQKHLFEPIPLKARKRPPVIPDRRNTDAKDATLFIQDIYEGPGLKDIPRGTVKSLRIFTYGYAYRLVGGHTALAIEGGWDTKRVLGTVPLEEDGSVMVKVPHSLPLSIQPLDENGQALQIMRSWMTAMPGERLSCVGCHESSRMPPPSRAASAARKAPQELTSWDERYRPYGFGFQREVQPVLDKYCVGCHNGQEARPNFADTSAGAGRFGNSYIALHPYVRRPGPESDLHLLNPMEYHASTSELMQMLAKGHHGVKLDADAYRRLNTWIDLNIPYYATWLQQRQNDPAVQARAARMVEYKKRYAGIDDNIEWMPATPIERPKFVEPAQLPPRGPAKSLSGWPLTAEHVKSVATSTKTLKVAGQEMTFARIPAGRFVMGSVDGALDEAPQSVVEIKKPFWMSVKEITNGEFRAFDPKHDSGAIDQQWKDHIYPGYPADHPEQPVIRVSWNEAMAYCEWLSEQAGQKISLPTEAQWEWAARAGSDKPFYFGESGYEKHANLADASIGLLAVSGVNPQPVPANRRGPLNDFVPRDASFDDGRLVPTGTAQYEANPWGLYDMHGNVAEWTRSDYRAYPYDAEDGRNSGKLTARKVARGGSWRDRPHRATSSFRLPYETHQKVFNVGFRVVIEE